MGGNQFFLGNSGSNQFDPANIENQLRLLKDYENRLKSIGEEREPEISIWSTIDSEISTLTEEQKTKLLEDEEYSKIYQELQNLVQGELLNLVRAKIEKTPHGQELLKKQLELTKKLKSNIVNETNQEMELFRKFKEFSKNNPDVTYEQFLKSKLW